MNEWELMGRVADLAKSDAQGRSPKRFCMSIPWSIWERLCDVAAKEHRPPSWQIEAFIIQGLDAYEKKGEI